MKVTRQLPFPVRGVSRQPPEVRAPGRVQEQINLLPDMAHGLVSRVGSRYDASRAISGVTSGDQAQALVAEMRSWGCWEGKLAGEDVTVLYPRAATSVGASQLLLIYNRKRRVFSTLDVHASVDAADVRVHGFSAVAAVGDLLVLARGGKSSDFAVEQDLVKHGDGGALDSGGVSTLYARSASVHVRGGIPGRKYTVRLHVHSAAEPENKHVVQRTFTAPSLLYPTPMDPTKDLSGAALVTSDPLYSEKIAAVTYKYQQDALAWQVTAANQSKPASIAAGLIGTFTVAGTAVAFANSNLIAFPDDPPAIAVLPSDGWVIDGIEVDDGGDGSLLRALFQEVSSVDELPRYTFQGKVVAVRPSSLTEPMYFQAVATGVENTGNLREVRWEEVAGKTYRVTPNLYVGKYNPDAEPAGLPLGTLELAAVPGEGLTEDHPTAWAPKFAARPSGDAESNPAPYFLGRNITGMFVLGGRLGILSDAVVCLSRSGDDYFNFWRTSVSTVLESDPIQMSPENATDDTISATVLYGRDMLFFGESQYAISGRTKLTPLNAAMPVVARVKGRPPQVAPVLLGDTLYFARGLTNTSVAILTPGQNPEQSRADDVSQQATGYIRGRPRQLLSTDDPDMLLVRTDHNTGFWVYRTANRPKDDTPILDSWFRLEYNINLGDLLFLGTADSGVLTFWMRQIGPRSWGMVVDFQDLRTVLPARDEEEDNTGVVVYVDSWVKTSGAVLLPGTFTPNFLYTISNENRTLRWVSSQDPALLAAKDNQNLYAGLALAAEFSPTPPQITDQDGAPSLVGTIVVANYTVKVSRSSGFTVGGKTYLVKTQGAVKLGRTNIGDDSFVVPWGRPALTPLVIRSRPGHPLVITSLAWSGQIYKRY